MNSAAAGSVSSPASGLDIVLGLKYIKGRPTPLKTTVAGMRLHFSFKTKTFFQKKSNLNSHPIYFIECFFFEMSMLILYYNCI